MSKNNLDPYSLSDIFREIELKLIKSMRVNLSKHERWENELGYQWEQWQISKLRSMSRFRVSNHNILSEYTEPIQDTIDQVLRQSYGKAYNDSLKLADEIGISLAGFDNSSELGSPEIPEENFFEINDDKLLSIIKEMQRDFKQTDGLILRRMDDIYRSVLSKAVLEMGTGSTTIQKAIDEATEEFLSKGIDCITYKDGKRVNIANYAEMYLRTASQKATFVAQGKSRDRMKVYTVLSSQHANCCEHCLRWQSIVMIDDIYTSISPTEAKEMSIDTKYPLLSDAMKDNFLHPNCRHTLSTFFPGKSTVPEPFNAEQEEEALRRYTLEQEQRKLENNLRKWKRVEAGAIDLENKEAAQKMAKKGQSDLRQHIKENPNLRREYWRERIEPTLGKGYPFVQDEEQFERYSRLLRPEDMPDTIEKFSSIKQLKSSEYELIKAKAKGMGYYNQAIKREPELTKLVIDVAKQEDLKPLGIEFNVKSVDSFLRKVETNFIEGKTDYHVKDINRYTLSSDSENLADRTLKSFEVLEQKGYNISELKNTWYDGSAYKGINTVVRDIEGNPFELQFHTPESFELKNGPLHILYEEQRILPKGSTRWIELQNEMIRMSRLIRNPIDIEKIRK